jgi:VWFA-related protein
MLARVLLLVTVLTAAMAAAQEAVPGFTDSIEVRIIDVDVVVTDRQGNRITTLNREDFELTENGKPVEIAYFSRIVDGRSNDQPENAGTQVPRTPVTWVVYVDQTNLPPARRNLAIRQLRSFFGSTMPEGDRAMLAVNDGMSMRVRQNLTPNRALLVESLAAVEKDRVHRGPALTQASSIRNEIRSADPSDREFVFIAGNIASQIENIIRSEAQRTRNALNTYNALVEAMSQMPGRVALLYVGAGFNTLPGLALAEEWRNRFQSTGARGPEPEDERESLDRDVSRLYANLSATRIAVYTIHASEAGGPSVEDAGSVINMDAGISGDRAALTEAGLAREMADRTGGLYFAINTALATKLDDLQKDVSNYYSLGYRPTGEPGSARRVRVQVKTPGARLRHRETVREPSVQERAGRNVVATALQPQRKAVSRRDPVIPAPAPSEANPLGVNVQAQRPQRDGWTLNHLLPFDFAVQLEALTFRPAGNVYRADFVMHFALSGPDGALWPLESREQSLQIPQAQIGAEGQATSYSWHVDLAPLKVPSNVPVNTPGMKLVVTVEDRWSTIRSVITSPLPERGR